MPGNDVMLPSTHFRFRSENATTTVSDSQVTLCGNPVSRKVAAYLAIHSHNILPSIPGAQHLTPTTLPEALQKPSPDRPIAIRDHLPSLIYLAPINDREKAFNTFLDAIQNAHVSELCLNALRNIRFHTSYKYKKLPAAAELVYQTFSELPEAPFLKQIATVRYLHVNTSTFNTLTDCKNPYFRSFLKSLDGQEITEPEKKQIFKLHDSLSKTPIDSQSVTQTCQFILEFPIGLIKKCRNAQAILKTLQRYHIPTSQTPPQTTETASPKKSTSPRDEALQKFTKELDKMHPETLKNTQQKVLAQTLKLLKEQVAHTRTKLNYDEILNRMSKMLYDYFPDANLNNNHPLIDALHTLQKVLKQP